LGYPILLIKNILKKIKKYLTNDGFMLKLLYIIKYFKLIKFIKEKT